MGKADAEIRDGEGVKGSFTSWKHVTARNLTTNQKPTNWGRN
jgi:hypothetical protein